MVSRYSLTRHTCTTPNAVRRKCCEEWRFTPRRSNLTLLLLLSIILFGCRPATPPPTSLDQTQIASGPVTESTSLPATPTIVPDEVKQLRNAPYQLGATDSLQVVQLKDGKFQRGTSGGTDYVSVTVTDFAAFGDLNGDGRSEVAALVSENYGGSGVFVFLAVYAIVDGAFTFQASTMVDDRPQLNALSIKNGEIFVDAVIHGPADPMCCPELHTTRHYRLVDNQLAMTDYTTFTPEGKPRTIEIEAPVNGTQAFNSVSMKGKISIAPAENSLSYHIYDVSGIELSAGPVSASAPNAGAPGTFEALVPLGNVLTGTVIRIEVQETNAADGSLLAMDSVELVVK